LAPVEQLARVRRFIDRVEAELNSSRPRGEFSTSGATPAQVRYYALKEQLHRVGELARGVAQAIRSETTQASPPRFAPRTPAEKAWPRSPGNEGPGRRHLRDIQAAHDIHDYLRDMAAAAPRAEPLAARLAALRSEAAMLEALNVSAALPETALLAFHLLGRPIKATEWMWLRAWMSGICDAFKQLDYHCEHHSRDDDLCYALRISGPGVWPLAELEAGVHVACRWHENLVPIQVSLLPGGEGPLDEHVEAHRRRRQTWLAKLAAGRTQPADDPLHLGRIVRFYEQHATLDLRTGQTLRGLPTTEERKQMLLAGLPLPSELEA
jgi:hypothetical protein